MAASKGNLRVVGGQVAFFRLLLDFMLKKEPHKKTMFVRIARSILKNMVLWLSA